MASQVRQLEGRLEDNEVELHRLQTEYELFKKWTVKALSPFLEFRQTLRSLPKLEPSSVVVHRWNAALKLSDFDGLDELKRRLEK